MGEIRPDIGVAAGQVLSQGRVDAFLQGVSEPGSLVRELRRLRAENAALKKDKERLRRGLGHAARQLGFLTNWLEKSYGGAPVDVALGRQYEAEARAVLSLQTKCPRCGEGADGLFNAKTDYRSEQGPFCNSCGWPEDPQAAEPSEGGDADAGC